MNNLPNRSLGKTPFQYLYGLDPRTPLDWAALTNNRPDVAEWVAYRARYRREANESLGFARTKMALYYDKGHKPITFNPGDNVYIILAKGLDPGYRLPISTNKLGEQRVRPFPVTRAIGKLAYELELPATWKIHPVISVVHLEPHREDHYGRDVQPPPEIIKDNDDDGHEEYEVETILRKRYNKRYKR